MSQGLAPASTEVHAQRPNQRRSLPDVAPVKFSVVSDLLTAYDKNPDRTSIKVASLDLTPAAKSLLNRLLALDHIANLIIADAPDMEDLADVFDVRAKLNAHSPEAVARALEPRTKKRAEDELRPAVDRGINFTSSKPKYCHLLLVDIMKEGYTALNGDKPDGNYWLLPGDAHHQLRQRGYGNSSVTHKTLFARLEQHAHAFRPQKANVRYLWENGVRAISTLDGSFWTYDPSIDLTLPANQKAKR